MPHRRRRLLRLRRSFTLLLTVSAAMTALACSSSDPDLPGTREAAGAAGVTTAGGAGGRSANGGSGGSALGGSSASAGAAGLGGYFSAQSGASGMAGGGASATAGAGGAAPTVRSMRSYTGSGANRGLTTGKLNIGQEFTVTTDHVSIQDLGVWDFGSNGLADAHVVTLFAIDALGSNPTATAVPGGSVTVPAGMVAPLDSGFRFAALPAQVELQPGNYAVVAYGMSDTGDPYGDGGNGPYSGSGVKSGGFSPFQFAAAESPAFPDGGDQNPHDSASFHFTSAEPAFVRIVPFGDSITDGQHGTQAGYRAPLLALLHAAHYPAQFQGSQTDNAAALPNDELHHEGHSGYQIQSLQDNVVNWLGPTGSPGDIVLLLAGTNDVVFNDDADFANAGKRLSKLISTIADASTGLLPRARVIVAELPPVVNTGWAAREVTYNASVAQVVADHAKLGENVRLVDMHAALTLADLFTDGEHPQDAGYEKMAKVWFDAIMAP